MYIYIIYVYISHIIINVYTLILYLLPWEWRMWHPHTYVYNIIIVITVWYRNILYHSLWLGRDVRSSWLSHGYLPRWHVGKDHLHHSYQRIGESWLLDVCFDHDCKERWHAIDTWAAGNPLHHSSDCSLSAASHHLSNIDFRILGSGRVKSNRNVFICFHIFSTLWKKGCLKLPWSQQLHPMGPPWVPVMQLLHGPLLWICWMKCCSLAQMSPKGPWIDKGKVCISYMRHFGLETRTSTEDPSPSP